MHLLMLLQMLLREAEPQQTEKGRTWFQRHLVGRNASKPACGRVRWRGGEAFRAIAERLTREPDPRATYIVVRGREGRNIEAWPHDFTEDDLAEWIEPKRTKAAISQLLEDQRRFGGTLVIRDVERIPGVRHLAARAVKATRRSLWTQDRVHIFHTVHNHTGSYAWHYDLSDNLLFGLAGVKRFRVAGRQPRSPVIIDTTLTDGVALYIPRKLFHNGVGLGPSTIISIALRPYRLQREQRERRWRKRRNRILRRFFSFFWGNKISSGRKHPPGATPSSSSGTSPDL